MGAFIDVESTSSEWSCYSLLPKPPLVLHPGQPSSLFPIPTNSAMSPRNVGVGLSEHLTCLCTLHGLYWPVRTATFPLALPRPQLYVIPRSLFPGSCLMKNSTKQCFSTIFNPCPLLCPLTFLSVPAHQLRSRCDD